MTPTDQTSTLLEILGGSFPTTKHSGGRYLEHNKARVLHFGLSCIFRLSDHKLLQFCVEGDYSSFDQIQVVYKSCNSNGPLTSMSPPPVMSAPCRPPHSCRRPWSWTAQSLWFLFLHMLYHSPAGCYLDKHKNQCSTVSSCTPSSLKWSKFSCLARYRRVEWSVHVIPGLRS